MKKVSLLIPVFRNAESLVPLFSGIQKVLNESEWKENWEILFVDDASDDGSEEQIKKICRENQEARFIRNPQNLGQVPSILRGLAHCKTEAVIIQSADMQEPPEMLLKMLQAWKKGSELVIGKRDHREDPVFNRLQSLLFFGTMKIFFPSIPAGGFDFVLLSGKVLRHIRSLPIENRLLQADILQAGSPALYIGYSRGKRKGGNSQWNFRKKLAYFLRGIRQALEKKTGP